MIKKKIIEGKFKEEFLEEEGLFYYCFIHKNERIDIEDLFKEFKNKKIRIIIEEVEEWKIF